MTTAIQVGFTGTRNGMSKRQIAALVELLPRLPKFDEVHHGCCKGADEQFSLLLQGNETVLVIGHPSDDPFWTSPVAFAHERLSPKAPLERNRDIVAAVDLLVACPSTDDEILRSGSWATVRYARKQGKRVVIIGPDGHVRGMSE